MTSVTVVGPGAVGCTVAGALAARRDVDLRLVGRTPFAELRVDGFPEPIRWPARFLAEPQGSRAASDIVIVATKAHQTAAVEPWLHELCGPNTVVAVLQNGIGQHELVRPLVGAASLVAALVHFPADRIAPGHVRVAMPARLEVAADDPGQAIADLFAGTHVEVHMIADFHSAAWTKLVANCGVGAVTTLTRRTNAVLSDPEARTLAIQVMNEAVAVGRADGAILPDGLADTLIDITLARSSGHVSSQTADRLANAAGEWDTRQGEIVRRADRHGIDVPALRTLTTLLRLGEPDVAG